MGKQKVKELNTAEVVTSGPESSGHTVIVNGVSIEIPHRVEVEGPEAVQDYLVEECAKRGVSHIPAPAPTPESEPTAPASTPSTGT